MGILYPQTCCFCGKISREKICNKCAEVIEYVQEPVCGKCGKPISHAEQGRCYDCSNQSFFYEQGRSVWLHKGPVRWSVYRYKYHNRRMHGALYAEELCRLYEEKIREWGIDLIVPVPLHRTRRRKRGYNQSEILAKRLGKLLGISVDTTSVTRTKKTRPQKELSHQERKNNLEGAFCVKSMRNDVKNVLIIDDIYTTGNTINEMAKSLKEKGVQKVFFLTISIGQGF